MTKTNLQRNASYYEKVIREAENSLLAPQYLAVCTALKELVEISKSLGKTGTQMSPQDYQNLKQKYESLQEQCRTYLAQGNEFSEFEEKRKGVIEDISLVLTRDMKVLNACDPEKPGTLSEIIGKSRSHTVFLKQSDIQTVGGAMSKRIPLKTPDGKRGFFTPMTTYNQDKEWNAQIDKYKEKFKGKPWFTGACRQRLEQLKTDPALQELFCQCCPCTTYDEYIDLCGDEERAENKVIMVACALGLGRRASDVRALFEMNKSLRQNIIDFIDDMASMVNYRGIMTSAGIKKDADLSVRNCAMTDMAQLLGCGDLLANTTRMNVVIDGKSVEGVFMETVDGTDLNRIKVDDPILYARKDSFENADALRKVTDLQVLDFICGNIDRHACNMIYQFEKISPKKVIFKGIKGIDNDCSFGTPAIEPGKRIQSMVNPEDMQFITESMRYTLETITEDNIHLKLANDKLSKDEIEAAWKRVQAVKEAADAGLIQTIPDNYWEEHKLADTDITKDNYLRRIRGVAKACSIKGYHTEKRGKNEVHYIKDRRTSNKVMFNNLDNISVLKEKMKDAKALFFNSSEYNLMKSRFEKVEELTAKVRECGSPEAVPETLAAKLENAYIDLADKTLRYVQLKKVVPYQERGQKRVNFVRELLRFANDTLDDMEAKPEMEADKYPDGEKVMEEPEEEFVK